MNDTAKKSLRILAISVFVFWGATAVRGQKATRIVLYKDSTAATVSSNLKSFNDKKVFVIKARKGQTLKIEQIIEPATAAARLVAVSIKSSSGKTFEGANDSCDNRREIAPTEEGDYTITVVQCRKTDAWRGRFRLKISVK